MFAFITQHFRGDVAPPELPVHTQNVTLIGLRLLNNLATLDLKMLQVSGPYIQNVEAVTSSRTCCHERAQIKKQTVSEERLCSHWKWVLF